MAHGAGGRRLVLPVYRNQPRIQRANSALGVSRRKYVAGRFANEHSQLDGKADCGRADKERTSDPVRGYGGGQTCVGV